MKEELEIQKKIDGFEKYSVSNQGNVRNDTTGRIMKKIIIKQKKKLTKNIYYIKKKIIYNYEKI